MKLEFGIEDKLEQLSIYRPQPVDDWEDYIRVIKIAINHSP